MTKLKQPHTSATNGLEAVERYTQSPHKYSCILTGMSSILVPRPPSPVPDSPPQKTTN